MGVDDGSKRRKVLSLAVAAGDQHDRAVDAVERRLRRGHRRSLRIVDVDDATRLGDAGHPVRQAFEAHQRREHRAVDLRDRGQERERRKRVERVVPPDEFQVRRRQEQRPATREPDVVRRDSTFDEPPRFLGFRNAGTECLHQTPRDAHCIRARIVTVEDLDAACREDPRLGRGIRVDPACRSSGSR
jgi:hypothetical protein